MKSNKIPRDKNHNLWTDRYKPKNPSDLVGNYGIINQLYEWLKDWDDVVIRGNKKQVSPFVSRA